jgi:hypothetical protein
MPVSVPVRGCQVTRRLRRARRGGRGEERDRVLRGEESLPAACRHPDATIDALAQQNCGERSSEERIEQEQRPGEPAWVDLDGERRGERRWEAAGKRAGH